MAETKDDKNNAWNVVRTILSALSTAFVIGCFKYLWAINNFMIATTLKDQRQDDTILQFKIDLEQTKGQQQKTQNDIIRLQAILPEDKKKQRKNYPNE